MMLFWVVYPEGTIRGPELSMPHITLSQKNEGIKVVSIEATDWSKV